MMKVDLNEMFYVMIQQSEDTQMVRSWAPSRAGVGARVLNEGPSEGS